MQKAKITSVQFFQTNHGEFANGICVEHPRIGTRGILAGHPIYTSAILKKFKNGNFLTINTHYFVVNS